MITVAEIEQSFKLSSYWFGEKWCPAVAKYDDGSYGIRILRSQTMSFGSRSESYEYFYVAPDGTITVAPRGHAKDFKPGRVVDIAEVAERFAEPQTDAMRVGW